MADFKPTPTYRPGTNGEAPMEWTDNMIADVSSLSAAGLRHVDIAAFFGLKKTMFYTYCRRIPELKKALKNGKARRIHDVSGKLAELIDEGNITAIIFYLRTQAGWRYADGTSENEDHDNLEAASGLNDDTERLSLDTKDPNEAAKKYQEIMLRTK